MTSSVARRTLERAEFFLERAAQSGIDDRTVFRHYFEAAIVFGRSVTFHIQSEFAHRPDFSTWYQVQQDAMRANPLSRFFLDQRNFVLKVGQLALSKHVSVEINGIVRLSSSLTVVVVRGQPWYRRPLRIILADLTYPLRAPHTYPERPATGPSAFLPPEAPP